ncbi:MAG TPA: ATP-dependent DNA ligase, partial [Nocardioides sp.]|nr:ATP-dependent DNA ligase [Nocardioides sp.]
MLLADLVATSAEVAATRSRTAKVAALARCLSETDPEDLPVVAAYLGGGLLQRRTGVGWRGVATTPPPAAHPTLTVREVHETFDRLASVAGTGSREARSALVTGLLSRATPAAQAWLRGAVTGSVRQ